MSSEIERIKKEAAHQISEIKRRRDEAIDGLSLVNQGDVFLLNGNLCQLVQTTPNYFYIVDLQDGNRYCNQEIHLTDHHTSVGDLKEYCKSATSLGLAFKIEVLGKFEEVFSKV